MSYKVLVIPEDATHDQYILKPVVKALLAHAGKPRAVVQVMVDPAVGGVDQALDVTFLETVIHRYRMVDLFVLCVDRDGRPGQDEQLARRERAVSEHLASHQRFVATTAHQVLEAWCLAGMKDLPREWSWQDVRQTPDCKRRYFEDYARRRNLLDAPSDGREVLGREAAGRYTSIRQLCPEVLALEERIASTVRA